MYEIQILWNGRWIAVQTCNSRDEGLWIVATWKQANECYGDPFRVALASRVPMDPAAV